MNNKSKTRIGVASLIALTLISCNKDEGPFYPNASPLDDTTTIYFSTDIQPVFNTYCTACHNASHAKLNLLDCCSYEQLWSEGFSAPYIDTLQVEQGNLYKHITGSLSSMPPSGLMPEYEINKIYQWIAQGAKNN